MIRKLSYLMIATFFVTSFAQEKPDGISFTPYGMAMYRLRYNVVRNNDDGNITQSGNYSNRIAYKLGLKVKANEQVSFQFEAGNDSYSTEEVTAVPNNFNNLHPWFSMAYVNWDPGYMHIAAGIIPVQGSSMLDLIGVSLLKDKNYAQAAHIAWGVVTNFSVYGLKAGAPITRSDFKLGFDFLTTVLEQRSIPAETRNFRFNGSAVSFIAELPMKYAGLSILPQFMITPSRNFSQDADGDKERDMEIAGGMELGYKVSDHITTHAGIGVAKISNHNSKADTVKAYIRRGINFTCGTAMKVGPGKLLFDFNLSSNEDLEKKESKEIYPFIDLKYGWGLNKHFTIMPRVRCYWYNLPENQHNIMTWPELIFTGSF